MQKAFQSISWGMQTWNMKKIYNKPATRQDIVPNKKAAERNQTAQQHKYSSHFYFQANFTKTAARR